MQQALVKHFGETSRRIRTTDESQQQARVTQKRGFGFLATPDHGRTGLFFFWSETGKGYMWDEQNNTFSDVVETRRPSPGDTLYYEVGPAENQEKFPGGVEAVRWAYVPGTKAPAATPKE